MNKAYATWSSNLRALQLFIKRNNRMPKSGEQAINKETGTNLLGWYQNQVHQYKSGKLLQGRLIILNTQLGDKWYEGVTYLNNVIMQNMPLQRLYPNVKDEGYNLSVITLYEKGVFDKKKAISLLQHNICHLYDVFNSEPELCTIDNFKKCFSLPEHGYCSLYQSVKRYRNFIYVVQNNEFKELKDFITMYRKTGTSLLKKNNLLPTIKCRFFDRMSVTETSEYLGVSRDTIKLRVNNAVRLLSQEYNRYIDLKENNKSSELSLKNMGLSAVSFNALMKAGFRTLSDFEQFYKSANSLEDIKLKITEYLKTNKIKNLGVKAVDELSACLWKLKCDKGL